MGDFPINPATALTATSNIERRGAVRHLCSRVCYARPNGTASGFTWGVTICDISHLGISILLRCQLQEGMILAIQPDGGPATRVLYARIVRGHVHAPGCWFYGCEFVQPISEDELQKWLGKVKA